MRSCTPQHINHARNVRTDHTHHSDQAPLVHFIAPVEYAAVERIAAWSERWPPRAPPTVHGITIGLSTAC